MTEQKNLYQSCQLIIFDLDGTLYEDTDHFSYFADLLKQELSENVQQAFTEEYQKMIAGHHIVTIGKVYDVIQDRVLDVDPETLQVKEAYTWEGSKISQEERQKHYSSPITFDFDTMIAIGDGWWLPNVCAKHFGATDTYRAYEKTKEFMATEEFKLTEIKRLSEGLKHLKRYKKIVLVTNSQADDVERLLHLLNLDGIFDHIVSVAKKPLYTKKHFSALMAQYNVNPSESLSIGDNYINEIAPALHLGMKTIFIDFYDLSYPEYTGQKVKSISETIADMLAVK